eukprot:Gb_06994 [translate_table: standard]
MTLLKTLAIASLQRSMPS